MELISIIKEDFDVQVYRMTIYELMYEEIRRKTIKLRDPNKKINDAVKIVGLDKEILLRSIDTLSTSEKKLVQIAISLLSNPELLILEEPFKYLDKNNTKKVLLLMQRIKDQYKKTIVIASNDSEVLYSYTKHIIFINKDIIVEKNTKDFYTDIDFLNENKITIPQIVQFTYLAKKTKKVKIDYHNDIRDIIKDIYKHV